MNEIASQARDDARSSGGWSRPGVRRHDAPLHALRAVPVPGPPWQEVELPGAIDRDELVVRYQPIVGLPDGEIVAVEALVAWDHPERGRIAPNDFIPAAERSGAIFALGASVLTTACQQVRAWQLEVPALQHLRVAVNVSAKQLNGDLIGTVEAALERSGLPAECLEIEVTESAVIVDMDGALEAMEGLAAIGVGISIDDFGTGFSSLAYLKRLPVTGLKIDKAFIDDLSEDPRDVCIVAAIIALSAALGLTQIAEGVETESQRRKLESLGCAHAQGYLFSRPVVAADFLAAVAPLVHSALPVEASATCARVVLCDDEESIRKLYRRALQPCGAALIDAVDGAECLERVRTTKPHLVVLDASLPGRSGVDIIEEIREASPGTRVVVVSGLVTSSMMETSLARGAEACVGKMQFLPQLRALVSAIEP